jgi:hypothetical protein
MLRLHANPLSSGWVDALRLLFEDIGDLGHRISLDRRIIVESNVPALRRGKEAREFWRPAHERLHRARLNADQERIRQFEHHYAHLFIEGGGLDVSAIDPEIVELDFSDKSHRDIAWYLQRYQTVTSRKLVGRRFGLLVFDRGQKTRRPLIGGVLLCSARYNQPARDAYLEWTSAKRMTRIRLRGLDRIMQLAVVCALPPYSRLAAAWFLAATPFTKIARQAFRRCASKSQDVDLAAVATTSGLDATGSPFERHPVIQLIARGGYGAHAKNGGGELYKRLESPRPLRASFVSLLSASTLAALCKLHCQEEPKVVRDLRKAALQKSRAPAGSARHMTRSNGVAESRLNNAALAFALRRLGLHRSLFDGNDVGVYMGALGHNTLHALRTGVRRTERPLVKWDHLVNAWRRKFTPIEPPNVRATEDAKDLIAQEAAITRRRAHAQAVALGDILLSSKFDASCD